MKITRKSDLRYSLDNLTPEHISEIEMGLRVRLAELNEEKKEGEKNKNNTRQTIDELLTKLEGVKGKKYEPLN